MAYRWKPSASQRKAFAEKMSNPDEARAHEQRKIDRDDKRRAGSKFDYQSAGGKFVPTQTQYDFCVLNMALEMTDEQDEAFKQIMWGYVCQEKVHHDQIHIVNELRRSLNR